MISEEATKTLKGEAWICYAEKWNEALEMAFEALESELCDDCVSRRAVLEYIEGSGAELGHSPDAIKDN